MEITIKILRWVFYLPLSILGGIIAGVICKWVMPYIALIVLWFCGIDYERGPVLFDFENTIYDVKISIVQYIVIIATIFVSIITLGIVAGCIAGKVCPSRNPHVSASTITILLLVCFVFSTLKMWDPDKLFVCITSIISYLITVIITYATTYSIKEDL